VPRAGRRVAFVVVAEESVIVSDQFELAIFLVRYPEARLVQHEEESGVDAFDVMTDTSRGFDWSK